MKIKYLNIVLALSLAVAGLMTPVLNVEAKNHPAVEWTVTFDSNEKLGSDYSTSALEAAKRILKVMPGDTVTYQATYKNASNASADFYLATDIVDSLEDGKDASGGAYTFQLYYTQGGNTTYLYNDDTVGGESDVVGLHQVKELNQTSLGNDEKTYYKLGTLSNGGDGTVFLKITLDGNSQDSLYMDAVANIDLVFGAEKTPTTPPEIKTVTKYVTNTKTNRVVSKVPGGSEIVVIRDPSMPLAGGGSGNPRTGDEILPVIACTVGLVLGILIILCYFSMEMKQRRKEVACNEEEQ
ncbi:conserved repeat domain-containing protein [Pseudobutyrivibrio sp. 49]|uniref:hypothetical protein n=1 Tax=Pseudobutyrivibrio sp. 49 TaxID=1855344 RepID=UPI00088D46E7|nr:hypothetical protein [Pseudobutyrivibrio sp. 49]SDH95496.1 conserved repeat domain-containing protein [Pseudobutyrivibrio sp. 49]